jgi:ferredoxin
MPTIQLDKCNKCLKCVMDCTADAIDIENGVIESTCIYCGHCVAICPESAIYPENGEINKLGIEAISSNDFANLTAGIRTCRSYYSKEIEDETIRKLIENMKHYPSASNARPIQIMHIKSKNLIQKLNDETVKGLIKMVGLITSPLVKPLLRIFSSKINLPRIEKYKNQFIKRQVPGSSQICHHAPSVLLFHAEETKYSMANADAYIWATYTSIYAKTLGLGTCFNGFIVKGLERNKNLKTELGIPSNHQVYASLLIGYPTVKYVNEVSREILKVNSI